MSWRVLTRAVAGAGLVASVMALPTVSRGASPNAVVLGTRAAPSRTVPGRTTPRPGVRKSVPLPVFALGVVAGAVSVTPPTPVADLAYGEGPTRTLDLYRPAGPGPHPLVVYVHGGGWVAGDKANADDVANVAALVARGYAVASVNYRLATEARFPAQLDDVRAALAWLQANAAAHDLAADRVGVFGVSAGAHLAALLGVVARDDVAAVVGWAGPVDLGSVRADLAARADCDGAWSDPEDPESFWAALVGGPVTEHLDLVAAADPSRRLAERGGVGLPRFLLAHGDLDCTVPLEQSARLATAVVTATGDPDSVELRVLTGAGHVRHFPREAELGAAAAFFDATVRAAG